MNIRIHIDVRRDDGKPIPKRHWRKFRNALLRDIKMARDDADVYGRPERLSGTIRFVSWPVGITYAGEATWTITSE